MFQLIWWCNQIKRSLHFIWYYFWYLVLNVNKDECSELAFSRKGRKYFHNPNFFIINSFQSNSCRLHVNLRSIQLIFLFYQTLSAINCTRKSLIYDANTKRVPELFHLNHFMWWKLTRNARTYVFATVYYTDRTKFAHSRAKTRGACLLDEQSALVSVRNRRR